MSTKLKLQTIPSATGGIARLACSRLREFGKDPAAIVTKAGARPEQVYDDSIRLEVHKQIKILELVSEELQDDLLGFHLARKFDSPRSWLGLLRDRIIRPTFRIPVRRKTLLRNHE